MGRDLISREECKQIQKNILREIDRLCEVNGLTYCVQYGTLLGAVRHKGFIPWDDDIDIILARNEYDKLIHILKNKKDTFCPWLDVIDSDTDGYFYPFAKAVDNRTKAKMNDNLTEHGIWVDIFPVDGLPKSKVLSNLHMYYCYFLRAITLAMTTDFKSNRLGSKAGIKRILNYLAEIIGKNRILNAFHKACYRYDIFESEYVANLFSIYKNHERFKKDTLFISKNYEFEEMIVKGPKQYHEVLNQLYGDYMKLPPEEKRRTHCITAWKI